MEKNKKESENSCLYGPLMCPPKKKLELELKKMITVVMGYTQKNYIFPNTIWPKIQIKTTYSTPLGSQIAYVVCLLTLKTSLYNVLDCTCSKSRNPFKHYLRPKCHHDHESIQKQRFAFVSCL